MAPRNPKPEDSWKYRFNQPMSKILRCVLFHWRHHYMFRGRTQDNDMACSKCRHQWTG